MEIKVIPKKWGSSLGIVLPKEVVDAKKIKENKEIIIEVKDARPKAGELILDLGSGVGTIMIALSRTVYHDPRVKVIVAGCAIHDLGENIESISIHYR